MSTYQELFLKKHPGSEIIRAVRSRRPTDLPKYQGGADQFVTLFLDRGELKVWAYGPIANKDPKTIASVDDIVWMAILLNVSDFVKNKLGRKYRDLIKSDTALQLELIKNYIKNDDYLKGHEIIQDPLVIENIPPQNTKAKEEPVPEKQKTPDKKDPEKPVVKDQESKAPAAISVDPGDPNKVTGKIILRKVSGPGEIIGETEIEISNGQADFTGIQFSDPGDYVISISSNSPDVGKSEINIKVLPAPEIVPQQKIVGEPKKVTGTRPIIAQIDKPTISLPPMVFQTDATDNNAGLVADTIGKFPFFNYMGSVVQERDILSFKLYYDGIIPKCLITFVDSQNMMKEVGYPQNNTKFEIFIHSKSESLKSIHLKFKVEKFKNLQTTYTILGILDIPGGDMLYNVNYNSYKGTSFEVIRSICKEVGIGFNSNINNTDDSMTWVLTGKKTYEEIKEIMKRSYITDTSFMSGYIDFYYCFNYVDMEKEMKRDISSDVGLETGIENPDKSNEIVNINLINETSMNKSCFYFEIEKSTQDSTSKSIKIGHKTKIKYYDTKKKSILVFDIDGATTDGSKSIILKEPKKEKKAVDSNSTTIDLGKIDTDNVHKNYLYAIVVNKRNLDEMGNNEMLIRIPSTNLNLYKYQKVNVKVVNTATTPTDTSRIIWRESGEWIIDDISFVFERVNGQKKFFQMIRLCRKELGKTPDEMKQKTEPKDTPEKKQNSNPIETPAPEINPNDIYRVKDKNGKEWLLSVNYLDPDGSILNGYLISIDETDIKQIIENTPQTSLPPSEETQSGTDQ
jgi:hypothetical protein